MQAEAAALNPQGRARRAALFVRCVCVARSHPQEGSCSVLAARTTVAQRTNG